MCKNCHYDPYLAGKVVFIAMQRELVATKTITEDGSETTVWVQPDDRERAYSLRCTSHHRGWIKVIFDGRRESFRAERAIAFIDE